MSKVKTVCFKTHDEYADWLSDNQHKITNINTIINDGGITVIYTKIVDFN